VKTAADVLDVAGLQGWKGITKPLAEAVGFVTILTSPDYDPAIRPPKGLLFAGRAETEQASLDLAISKARNAVAIQ
jgi:hypothetical protein